MTKTLNRKTYESPRLSQQSLAAEAGFAASEYSIINAWVVEEEDDALKL